MNRVCRISTYFFRELSYIQKYYGNIYVQTYFHLIRYTYKCACFSLPPVRIAIIMDVPYYQGCDTHNWHKYCEGCRIITREIITIMSLSRRLKSPTFRLIVNQNKLLALYEEISGFASQQTCHSENVSMLQSHHEQASYNKGTTRGRSAVL